MEFVYICIGAFVGSLITSFIYLSKRVKGVLRIDRSDPERDKFRFEIDDISNIHTKKRIELTIDSKANLSQDQQSLL